VEGERNTSKRKNTKRGRLTINKEGEGSKDRIKRGMVGRQLEKWSI